MTHRKRLQKFSEKLQMLAAKAEQQAEQLGLNPGGVQIVASVESLDGEGKATMVSNGSGNFHARMGATEEWLRSRQQQDAGYWGEIGAQEAREEE